jgi:simple sugar transport system permease protein
LLTFWKSVRLPILAFFTAFLAGALLIIFTDLSIYAEIQAAFAQFTLFKGVLAILAIAVIPFMVWFSGSGKFKDLTTRGKVPERWTGLSRGMAIAVSVLFAIMLLWFAGFSEVLLSSARIAYTAYSSLLEGSVGNMTEIGNAIRSGSIDQVAVATNPLSESLVAATPYIFGALSVAIALRCGIFNIGTEGQIYMGALASVIVGIYLKGLPAIIHIPLAILAGAFAGAFWAAIPALLKTKFGSNEVINTIMLNYVAFKFVEYLLIGPLRRPEQSEPFSAYIQASAELPRLLPYPNRFHIGFFIAIAIAILMYWFLFHTPVGLEIRLVGRNPNASKYAGIDIKNRYVLAFLISGAMAGLAGANEILGVNHYLSGTISPGYGFNSISLSILGNNHPIGVIFTSLMFGFLSNGSTRMQNIARIPIEIITIMQALIIGFIAAPTIIQKLFHLKEDKKERIVVTRGWGK